MRSPTLSDALSRLGADGIYMLLHPGWEREASSARGNRWHYALRWARHVPVTLVIPEPARIGRASQIEARIQNCQLLHVYPAEGPFWPIPGQLQVGQILAHMKSRRIERPVLWIYNPAFAEAFVTLPAASRVHHVTENYFDWPSTLDSHFLARLQLITEAADVNVAVSDGCAEPLRTIADPARILVAKNGCDFATYGAPGPLDADVLRMKRGFEKVAIFAGGINDRLDFELIEVIASGCPDTLLLLVGPVELNSANAAMLDALVKRPNVRAFGPVHPDRLPAMYRAADVGFLPYDRRVRYHVESGFPLKALEMAATGLPVVSIRIRELALLAPPLVVVDGEDAFVAAMANTRRQPESEAQLRHIASESDYDVRFSAVVNAMATVAASAREPVSLVSRQFYRETTAVMRPLLVRHRRSWPVLSWHARRLGIARFFQLATYIPGPLLRALVRLKRAIVRRPAVAE